MKTLPNSSPVSVSPSLFQPTIIRPTNAIVSLSSIETPHSPKMEMSSAAIVVHDLRKSYDGVEALRGVSFEVGEGEVFGLLGPNGAGKTTTVEILEGYRSRDGGEASVLGHDPGNAPRELRERIGVVLQHSENAS